MSHTETGEQEIIHRQMTIQEILSLFPQKSQRLAQEITNAGLHCVGCHAATWETLEAGMRSHGYDEAAITRLLKKLNAVMKSDFKADKSTVTLTPKAAEKFLEFSQAEGKQGCALFFSDKLEGCSGFTYILDFSDKAGPNDSIFTSHGIEIHVPNDRLDRLVGSVIDFVQTLSSTGFYVENPNTASSCGCGSSHNYSKESRGGGCCGSSSKSSQEQEQSSGGGCCGSSPKPSQDKGHGGGCCSH
ncbi:MAG: iron-sulfur cluster assembly accessory protein [Parachlamydiales bacterium]|jgi:iron-sulfur cluster assembly accessory protein